MSPPSTCGLRGSRVITPGSAPMAAAKTAAPAGSSFPLIAPPMRTAGLKAPNPWSTRPTTSRRLPSADSPGGEGAAAKAGCRPGGRGRPGTGHSGRSGGGCCPRRAVDRGSIGAQAGVGRAVASTLGGERPAPAFSDDLSSRPRPDPGVQHAPCQPAPALRTAAACAPGRRLAYWLLCAQTVDNLCRKAPDLSAHAEMLGIPAAGPAHKSVFNCKNNIHTLCTGRN